MREAEDVACSGAFDARTLILALLSDIEWSQTASISHGCDGRSVGEQRHYAVEMSFSRSEVQRSVAIAAKHAKSNKQAIVR